jgi:hypothetical protein
MPAVATGTKQEILTKAMQQAYKNGWRPLHSASFNNCRVEQWQDDKLVGIAVLFPNRDMTVSWVRELEGIIFNHDFARALWGDRVTDVVSSKKWWQYHLERMVVAHDPIAYLGENI